ncbi:ABC transporter permease [Marisediminicola senii]|uniref:ABC transporter permease n=1 Tax=Marisediminicola senii TaxID=2711233 RepID=UPI001F43E46A|nr:ABC transporter permease [Marisediminicola senii]
MSGVRRSARAAGAHASTARSRAAERSRALLRGHAPSILVATLSSAFGVALLLVTGNLAIVISADSVAGAAGTLPIFLAVVSLVFIAIATYVGAIVTANTFATIIAGRTRTIALMRLIGATARSQRRAVAREGLAVGIVGAVCGFALGTVVTVALMATAVGTGFVPALGFDYAQPLTLIPVVGVVVTTWIASWLGSRRVLTVTPMQATGAAEEASHEEATADRGRTVASVVMFAIGTLLLALSVVAGLVNPAAVLIGVVGGMLSFSGLVLGSHLVMPPALRVVGRMLGSRPSSRLAAENAMRYPERSARSTIGLVIGVTLVTMFSVAVASFQRIIEESRQNQPGVYYGIDEILTITVVVFSVLIGFSALIAAVGMMNTLSLSVLQRGRELGLLRALGFTSRQLRSMILAESAQLTVAAVLVGLVLGTGYGWVGAQSFLGSINGSPGLVAPVVPPWLLAVVALSAAVLTVAASIAPTRRATRISPVAALAAT